MYTRTEDSINEVAKTLRGVEARVAGVTDDSVVDGPGLRMTVFFAGCRPKYTTTTGQVIHCPGCHNLAIQSLTSGQPIALDDLLWRWAANPAEIGVTLSGGDPFDQAEPISLFAKAVHALGGTVWAYSGYTLPMLMADAKRASLLVNVDVVVDGPFVLSKRTLLHRFRGSANQRVLDVKQSLAAGEPVWADGFSPEQ